MFARFGDGETGFLLNFANHGSFAGLTGIDSPCVPSRRVRKAVTFCTGSGMMIVDVAGCGVGDG